MIYAAIGVLVVTALFVGFIFGAFWMCLEMWRTHPAAAEIITYDVEHHCTLKPKDITITDSIV